MAKLRHVAIQVPDLEKAAAFYEGAFDLKRVSQVESPIGNAISLSDGVMNLTLLHFPEGTKGGKGGLGNLHFKSSVNRAPRQFTRGEPGEQRMLEMELRVLADVGLLGMPNAGKSTLIRAVSSARPKVADYPFTTLHPNLGVVRVDESRSFVVADIPGLIEGAAEGAGLGHQFLRHLQRTHLLLHLVDMAPFDEDADPAAEVKALANELKKYDPKLAKKPRWLVINKADLLEPKVAKQRAAALVKKLRWTKPWFVVSAIKGEGTRDVTFAVMDFLEEERGKARGAGGEK